MYSLIFPITRSSRSVSFSWIHVHRPPTPSFRSVLKTSTFCSIWTTNVLAEALDDASADVRVGQPENLQDEVDDPGEVQLRGHRDPDAPELAEEEVHQRLLQVGREALDEEVEAALDRVDEVSRKRIG